MSVPCLAMFLLSAGALGADPSILANGGFESVAEVRAGADGLVQGWRLAQPPLVPAAWSLNTAYPGALEVGRSEPGKPAHGGERFVRITAMESGPAHLYQMCQGLESGKWYRVSAWVRGGAVTLSFYEYFKGKMGGQATAHIAWGHCDVQGNRAITKTRKDERDRE